MNEKLTPEELTRLNDDEIYVAAKTAEPVNGYLDIPGDIFSMCCGVANRQLRHNQEELLNSLKE